MRTINFAGRSFKEIIRDPLSIVFALLLPLFLLFIFQQFKIPNEAYQIENFTPGIIVFGFSFITLFTASLVAKDRSTSLLSRLYASPMKDYEYVLGYIVAILPIVFLQCILFFALALLLGLPCSFSIIGVILFTLPISVFFIALGLIVGSLTSEKAASGVSSIIVQLVAFTSGMYFSPDIMGKFFGIVCQVLPFMSCVNGLKGILNHQYQDFIRDTLIIGVYCALSLIIAGILFSRNRKGE